MTSIDGNKMNGPIQNNDNNNNIDPKLEGMNFGRFEEILAELSDLETDINLVKKKQKTQKTEKLESVVLENTPPHLSQIHAIDEGIVGVGKLKPISDTEYKKINSHINALIQNQLPQLPHL